MEGLNARLEGFAREQLKQGHGEWWIVTEMVRRTQVDETEAREIVARVAPQIYVQFIRRRRSFLRIGLIVLAMSVAALVWFSHVGHATVYSLVGLVVGSFVLAHGWPGWRRLRSGDAPTSIPGSSEAGPVRTGLGWRAEPFEWK